MGGMGGMPNMNISGAPMGMNVTGPPSGSTMGMNVSGPPSGSTISISLGSGGISMNVGGTCLSSFVS